MNWTVIALSAVLIHSAILAYAVSKVAAVLQDHLIWGRVGVGRRLVVVSGILKWTAIIGVITVFIIGLAS